MNFIVDNLNSICNLENGYLLDIEQVSGNGYDVVMYDVSELSIISIDDFKSLGLNEEVYEVNRVTLVKSIIGGMNND